MLLWAQGGSLHPDTWVVLLDPDMVMVGPLVLPVAGQVPEVLYRSTRPLGEALGLPAVGQRYKYMATRWAGAGLRLAEVCEAWAEGCLSLDGAEVAEHFSVGPPWVFRFGDLQRAAPLWHAYVPRIRRQYRQLIAEMYAYSLAFASIGVRHALFDHFVVSYPNAPADEQAWAWVDRATVEEDPCAAGRLPQRARRPAFLHYCEIYYVEDWYFRKRQGPHEQVLSCEAPLFAEPPHDLLQSRRALSAARQDNSDWALHTERHAWFMCVVLAAINEAVLALRGPLCPEGFNTTKSLLVLPPKDAFSDALRQFMRSPAA